MRPISKQILVFLVLVFAFSSVPYALMIHSHHIGAGNGMVVRLVMWCPTLAAVATCALFRIDLATLGWNWRPAKYVVLAYLLPLFYALPVYLACWIAVKGSFAFDNFARQISQSYAMPGAPRLVALGLGIPLLATLGMTSSLSTALGEEIGWRGFLLPRLTGRFGFTVGCLISGAVWAVWHYPGLLWADYNAGTNPRYALACFTVMVIATAFPMGWLRLKSGSLWPCAVLHASHNLFVQAVFDRMTAPAGHALYITTEFGAGLALTITATALFFWTRRAAVTSINVEQEVALENI
ncbi:MAG TPA: type II CAAX endopeptidase family protein [Terracidiphilus sp.]|nr:type II CAAX endopeptidase family protein [Terracidiphilus sp.]